MSILNSICPNCGGQIQLDDQKTKGFCMHCGSEINIQNAIKTIKIDHSSKVENLIQLLINSKDAGNNEKAEKISDEILSIDPTISLVWKIRASAILWQSTIKDLRLKEGLKSYISSIEKYKDDDLENYVDSIISDYQDFLMTFVTHTANHYGKYPSNETSLFIQSLINRGLEGLNEVSSYAENVNSEVYINNLIVALVNHGINNAEYKYNDVKSSATTDHEFNELVEIVTTNLDLIDYILAFKEYSDENRLDILTRAVKYCNTYKSLKVVHYDNSYTYVNNKRQLEIDTWKSNYITKIKVLNPSYVEPQPSVQGCYIATNVYGDYNHPRVWVLRRYRDFSLRNNFFGRTFIKVYYRVSPILVKKFGKSNWFTLITKRFIDKKVDSLLINGYSDKEYIDNN